MGEKKRVMRLKNKFNDVLDRLNYIDFGKNQVVALS
jgi:hypothetical protein